MHVIPMSIHFVFLKADATIPIFLESHSAARKPSYKNSLKQEISPCRLARKFTFQALPAKSKVTLYGRPIVDHVDHILRRQN